MTNLKEYLKIGALTTCIVLSILFSGCVQEIIKPPTVEVINVEIIGLSLNEATVNTTVLVHNPNPMGGTFNRINYTIYFKDERPVVGSRSYEFLGYSVDEKKVTITTGNTTMYTFFNLRNREVLQALVSLSTQGYIWIKVNGIANLDLKATSFNIPFEKEILVLL